MVPGQEFPAIVCGALAVALLPDCLVATRPSADPKRRGCHPLPNLDSNPNRQFSVLGWLPGVFCPTVSPIAPFRTLPLCLLTFRPPAATTPLP